MTFTHAISWFEIPATDLDRAQKFYETIFDMQMIPMDLPNIKMRMFPISGYAKQVWAVHCATVADFINLLQQMARLFTSMQIRMYKLC